MDEGDEEGDDAGDGTPQPPGGRTAGRPRLSSRADDEAAIRRALDALTGFAIYRDQHDGKYRVF